mmetsp:Transcript_22125/g.56532  ORF Transcript_22125/g.56532 Transcript_22125/m.56532 type:complete len:122 (-) Transcript_22125:52-417(-)
MRSPSAENDTASQPERSTDHGNALAPANLHLQLRLQRRLFDLTMAPASGWLWHLRTGFLGRCRPEQLINTGRITKDRLSTCFEPALTQSGSNRFAKVGQRGLKLRLIDRRPRRWPWWTVRS